VAGLVRRIEVVDHDLRLGRVVEPILDALVGGDAMPLGDVERALAERHAVGRVQALEHLGDGALAVLVDDRVDVLEVAVADEHRPLVAQRQRARLGDAVGVHLDLEPGRHLELVERQLARRTAGEDWRDRVQRRAVLIGRAALLPRGAGADAGACAPADAASQRPAHSAAAGWHRWWLLQRLVDCVHGRFVSLPPVVVGAGPF
jgi:hypothetical protein